MQDASGKNSKNYDVEDQHDNAMLMIALLPFSVHPHDTTLWSELRVDMEALLDFETRFIVMCDDGAGLSAENRKYIICPFNVPCLILFIHTL
jgi:hypothetical protein